MEYVPSNEADFPNSHISNKLKAICEQFAQCHAHAERAKQHLAKEKFFTPTQCKRATQFLFDPHDDPTRDLCELLKHRPLPPNIASQSHSLSLTLQEFEKERSNLQACIDERDKREFIVSSIESVGKQFKQLIRLLGGNSETVVPLNETVHLLQTETDINNAAPSELLPETRKGLVFMDFDPKLGVRRLYELFKDKSLPPSQELMLLDARLQQNLQTKQMRGEYPTNRAEWAEIIDCLVQLATKEWGINFNDLCHPYPTQMVPGLPIGPIGNETAIETERKPRFHFLCDILTKYVEDIDLQRICRNVGINYESLQDKSHETRAFSLTRKLENQDRLGDLEFELRRLLPRRFPPENH
jgi:hypothetical protein